MSDEYLEPLKFQQKGDCNQEVESTDTSDNLEPVSVSKGGVIETSGYIDKAM